MPTIKESIAFFISNNDRDKLKDYYEKLYESYIELNKQLTQLGLYIVLIVFGFYVILQSKTTSLKLDEFTIEDKGLILKIIPMVYSACLLRIVVLMTKRNRIVDAQELLFNHLFSNDTLAIAKREHQLIRELLHQQNFIATMFSIISEWRITFLNLLTGIIGIIILFILPILMEVIFLITMLRLTTFDWLTVLSLIFSICTSIISAFAFRN